MQKRHFSIFLTFLKVTYKYLSITCLLSLLMISSLSAQGNYQLGQISEITIACHQKGDMGELKDELLSYFLTGETVRSMSIQVSHRISEKKCFLLEITNRIPVRVGIVEDGFTLGVSKFFLQENPEIFYYAPGWMLNPNRTVTIASQIRRILIESKKNTPEVLLKAKTCEKKKEDHVLLLEKFNLQKEKLFDEFGDQIIPEITTVEEKLAYNALVIEYGILYKKISTATSDFNEECV